MKVMAWAVGRHAFTILAPCARTVIVPICTDLYGSVNRVLQKQQGRLVNSPLRFVLHRLQEGYDSSCNC